MVRACRSIAWKHSRKRSGYLCRPARSGRSWRRPPQHALRPTRSSGARRLEANIPKGFETILANCSAHGRRKFVELHSFFPEECRVVLETFRKVYHNDDLAKGKSKEERLRFHQEHSGPLMKTLKEWLEAQI